MTERLINLMYKFGYLLLFPCNEFHQVEPRCNLEALVYFGMVKLIFTNPVVGADKKT